MNNKTPEETQTVEEFRNKWEGANATTGVISTLMMDRMVEDIEQALKTAEARGHTRGLKDALDITMNRAHHKVSADEIRELITPTDVTDKD